MATPQKTTGITLNDGVYGFIRRVAIYLLPALGTLYSALAEIWGLDYSEEVLGTTSALGAFLGAVIFLSRRAYNGSDAKYDGQLVVDTSNEQKDIYSLEMNVPLDEVRDKKELTFKINPSQ